MSIMVKNNKGKVCNMYQDEYKRWLAADLEDADLKPELAKVEGNDDCLLYTSDAADEEDSEDFGGRRNTKKKKKKKKREKR